MKTSLPLTPVGVTQNNVSHCIFLPSGPVFLRGQSWFVKYNQDISMLSLSCSLEFRDVLNSVLDLPCFDVPRRGR